MDTSWVVIIPAAGTGSRFGGSLPKQYVELDGVSILVRTVRNALAHPSVTAVVVAVHPSMMDHASNLLGHLDERIVVVEGDVERQHSIARCLQHPACASADVILVHDAVRPFATAALFERVGVAAALHGAAIPAVPVTDTIKQIDADGFITTTLPRASLRAAQTPQGFRRSVLIHAYEHAAAEGVVGTDDASLVEALGGRVTTVEGMGSNIKITTQLDMDIAHHLLRMHGLA
ncbi:MAG: 2-C-methyl-D-erythritol 4-phosphate cytidylyltransferase [Candidatus Kapabacteria bacterium]|nr:2-C-methyl-D-erythritol 4-phosphate cytidylyltransferase [Candidatus Kapabacteria bacterium]